MKDGKDDYTVDGIGVKRGRPCKDPLRGPMDAALRMSLYRARKKRIGETRQLTMSKKAWGRIEEIAVRKNVTVTEIMQDMVLAMPMPKK